MTWSNLYLLLLSCLIVCGYRTENYLLPWYQRYGKQMQPILPPQAQQQQQQQQYGQQQYAPSDSLIKPIMENYPNGQDDTNVDYTEYERKQNINRQDDMQSWQQPQPLPPRTNVIPTPYSVVADWPSSSKKLGQISAVTFDQDGNVVLFHRGDHAWDASTFNYANMYLQKDLGPIEDTTIITYDTNSGKLLHEWGSNIFFMPHGLNIDKDGNIWVTDVALHQVFKYSPRGQPSEKPLIELGVRFEPGSDNKHFCKPSGVAVTTQGDFFVSDGYCNHRIIKYNSKGNQLLVWGRKNPSFGPRQQPPPNAFAIPHALTLAEDKGLVCVADRENGRIQCFSSNNGTFISQIKLPEFGSKLFSVAYSPVNGGLLYAVNGEDYGMNNGVPIPVRGFVIGITSQQLVAEFAPNSQGFQTPHDIAVDAQGKNIFVVQLNPHKIWKFADGTPLSNFSSDRLQLLESTSLPKTNPSSSVPDNTLSTSSPHNINHQALQELEEKSTHLFSLTMQIFIALAAIIALVILAIVFVFIRRKGPWLSCWLCYKRWQFRRESSNGGFKFGSFLDPHSGFEQVRTDMSDEEEIDMTANTNNTNNTNNHNNKRSTTDPLISRA